MLPPARLTDTPNRAHAHFGGVFWRPPPRAPPSQRSYIKYPPAGEAPPAGADGILKAQAAMVKRREEAKDKGDW